MIDINDSILNIDNNKKNTSITKLDINDINKLIIEMKNSGFSPKKIQYDLKRNYNYEITQQLIRNLS